MILINEIIQVLEKIAPPIYQESYDNSGLIVGDRSQKCTGVIISLDAIEAIVDEAIEKKCNLIIAHHPIVFRGLKTFTGKNYIEKTIIKAIQNNIAIYAIHTNLDNALSNGVNQKIAEKIGLKNQLILQPKKNLFALSILAENNDLDSLRKTLITAGAGSYGKSKDCSFTTLGVQSNTKQNSTAMKLEFVVQQHQIGAIKSILNQKEKIYNYSLHPIENENPDWGAGIVGELEKPMSEKRFLKHLKKTMDLNVIKHTAFRKKKIKKVALCGGSGGFLLNKAISIKADVFITSDYKYHEFFDTNNKILLADIGHYESEQYTIELIYNIISNNFLNFAVYCTKIITNPVKYFV